MKVKKPLIADQITSVTLGNGLRIYVAPNHRAPVVTAQIWVETGSIHEEEYLGCGLSHFLEHMLFSGTEKFPGKTEISDRATMLGAKLNAWTSYNHTAYYMEGPSSTWKQLADMLCDMVSQPLFPEDAFQKEKGVILRECAMRNDNPDTILFETLISNRFRTFPMRYPVVGLQEGIEKVDREMMTRYYNKRYSPRRTYVVIAGDVEPQEVTAYINELLGGTDLISIAPWPEYDESKTVDDTVELPVQINGKVKTKVFVPNNASKDEILAIAKSDEKVSESIEGKTVIKEIVVPGKIINIVVK